MNTPNTHQDDPIRQKMEAIVGRTPEQTERLKEIAPRYFCSAHRRAGRLSIDFTDALPAYVSAPAI